MCVFHCRHRLTWNTRKKPLSSSKHPAIRNTVFYLISEHTLISEHPPPILCWWRLLPEHIEIYVYWLCYCVASCNRYLMLINHSTDGATRGLTLRVCLLGRQKKKKLNWIKNCLAGCPLIRSNTVGRLRFVWFAIICRGGATVVLWRRTSCVGFEISVKMTGGGGIVGGTRSRCGYDDSKFAATILMLCQSDITVETYAR